MSDVIDFYERPSLPVSKLASVTNMLAWWLPAQAGNMGDEVVAGWEMAEWKAAAWIVYWQNALPWLVKRVRQSGVAVPASVWEQLTELDVGSRERTRRMLDGCVELLGAFRAHEITAVPFKGAVLAACYYPDPLERPLADLDLLIHPKDIPQAIQIVRDLGYRFYSRSAEDEVYLRGERKRNVWAPDNVHPIELHYALREEYAGIGYEVADVMWEMSEERPFWNSVSALVPRLPALLLHVCAHATSDWLIQRGRLMHIGDISLLVGQMTATEWEELVTTVSPQEARFVYPALAFATRYARLDLPEAVLAYFRTHCPPSLLHWIEQTELADTSESNPADRSGLGLAIAQRLSRNRLEMARFWLRSFFPRRWNLSKRYPRLTATPLWPLGYVLINLDRAIHIWRKLGTRHES
ncbi:MAG: hypothetical protein D6706_22140 [Chloroflexi bacterium]|nr:MAG: hypothetical protein D6706_22140 [Chloroflexota bacterium]